MHLLTAPPPTNMNPHLAEAGGELLDRAKLVADQITARIRHLLEMEEPPAAKIDPNRPLRVLCVDDNEDAADSLAALSEMFGCEARACYDGPSALDTVREFRPDACFLDLSMPGMDGVELATRLRAGAGYCPLLLVAVTALGLSEDRARTAVAGFHYHFVKPTDPVTIRSTLDRFRTMLTGSAPESLPPLGENLSGENLSDG